MIDQLYATKTDAFEAGKMVGRNLKMGTKQMTEAQLAQLAHALVQATTTQMWGSNICRSTFTEDEAKKLVVVIVDIIRAEREHYVNDAPMKTPG